MAEARLKAMVPVKAKAKVKAKVMGWETDLPPVCRYVARVDCGARASWKLLLVAGAVLPTAESSLRQCLERLPPARPASGLRHSLELARPLTKVLLSFRLQAEQGRSEASSNKAILTERFELFQEGGTCATWEEPQV
jgi:hypothetical protein